jgi:HTH-type transcriptional regulator / antitoxin HigA
MSEMVTVRPIRTEADYESALAEIGTLMTSRPGTREGDRLDVLSTLVEAYETERHAIDAPDPIALVEFVMEQRGLDRAELGKFIGSRGRVSEVLNRARPLSLPMIRRLHAGLGLPASVLVKPYRLRKPKAA